VTTDSKRLRILAVLPDIPWPLNSGKRIREWSVVSALAHMGDLDVITVGLDVEPFVVPPGVGLQTAETVVLSYRKKVGSGVRLAGGRPWRMAVADWATAAARIAELNSGPYDVVWFGSLDAWVELRVHVGEAKAIVDIDDIETEKIASFLATPPTPGFGNRVDRLQGRVERVMWSRIQKSALKRTAAVTVCSSLDAAVLGAANAAIVPNCFPVPPRSAAAKTRSHTVLLVGNYAYEPNLDGARFMARDVMPSVVRRFPDARLLLVGRGAADEIAGLGRLPWVEAIGEVESTEEYLETSQVAVAPVRFGGGTRIKLIEAFAYSLASVSTTVGCYGLDVVDGRELLVADTAADFADAVCRVLGDDVLGQELGSAGHALYAAKYQPSAVIETIRGLVAEVAAS